MKKIILGLLLFTANVFSTTVIPDGAITAVKLGAKSQEDAINYTVTAAANTPANSLTIALKTQAGTDPTGRDVVKISFRSSTASSGAFNQRSISSALSMVVSSGSTLGTSSATTSYIFVYALDNAGTVELAISSKPFNTDSVTSTTAEGGAGGADSGSTIYSTTARTNVPFKLIAVLTSNQTTAGTWTSNPTEISLTSDTFINKFVGSAASTPVSVSYSTTSTSYVTPNPSGTSMEATYVSTGRPAILYLQPPAGSSFISNIYGSTSVACTITVAYSFNGGSENYQQEIRLPTSTSTVPLTIPPLFVALNPGKYTVAFRVKTSSASCSFNMYYMYFGILEL